MNFPNKMKQKIQILKCNPKRYWIYAIILLGFIALIWDQNRATKAAKTSDSIEELTADTYIPAGHVLIPIEVSNYESLDSILGQYGVVDLFIPAEKAGGKSTRLAHRIKMIRAPLNRNRFAVLAPESESRVLVQHEGAFFVVIQNPKNVGTEFEDRRTSPVRHTSRIQVEHPAKP